MLKRFLVFLFITFWAGVFPCAALDFDVSIDEEIKKKYNSTKLQDEVLPSLPKIEQNRTSQPSDTASVPKSQLNYTQTAPVVTSISKTDGLKIPAWTKFNVKSNSKISDWQTKGTAITFSTTSPVYKRYVTIPAGTVFRGNIVKSHQPQITGNGGLVVLQINSMTYNGKTYPVNAKITKFTSKKVFFNNMKGQRKYLKGVATRVNTGEKFYKKAKQKASKMADNPVLIILSPVPAVVGMAGCAVCTVLSPLTALTVKGSHLSIPAGSAFEIKLLDSAYVK